MEMKLNAIDWNNPEEYEEYQKEKKIVFRKFEGKTRKKNNSKKRRK